jgi:mannose-6-phosphate isomerase-like protein (cupin superfamily)
LRNIRIIKTGINVSKIALQLKQYPTDWGSQKHLEHTESLIDRGWDDLPIDALQLVMGVVANAEDFVGDSESSRRTPAYDRHTEIVSFMKRHFHKHDRCGFLSLPIGGEVGQHIDIGSYYQTRDRYHLAIQGTYDYTVGGETVRVNPGDLIWFNNKLSHGTKNVGDCVRITFVFDVPHSKNNP